MLVEVYREPKGCTKPIAHAGDVLFSKTATNKLTQLIIIIN